MFEMVLTRRVRLEARLEVALCPAPPRLAEWLSSACLDLPESTEMAFTRRAQLQATDPAPLPKKGQ